MASVVSMMPVLALLKLVGRRSPFIKHPEDLRVKNLFCLTPSACVLEYLCGILTMAMRAANNERIPQTTHAWLRTCPAETCSVAFDTDVVLLAMLVGPHTAP